MEKIKENGVLIGVVLFVLFIIGFIFMSSTTAGPAKGTDTTPVVTEEQKPVGTFVGSIATYDNAKSFVTYSFALPESAASTVEEDGAYVVTTLVGKAFTKVYFSDERTRGYTSLDYLKNLIAPKVAGFTMGTTEEIGGLTWQKAESGSMEWFVASTLSGKWLVMVEGYKKDHDEIVKTLKSMKVDTTSTAAVKKVTATRDTSTDDTSVGIINLPETK